MANPFDQFDPPAVTPPAATPNPFDQFDPPAPAAAEPADPSQLELQARAFGLGTRATIKGLLGLPLAAADAVNAAGDLYGRYADWLYGPAIDLASRLGVPGLPPTQPGLPPSAAVDRIIDATGLPRPETPEERVTGRVVEGVSGAASGVGMARTVAREATNRLVRGAATEMTKQPALQGVSGATAGAAGGVAHEAGADPFTELAISVLGGFAPAATIGGTRGGARVITDYFAPTTEAGRQETAARVLRRNASNAEVIETLPDEMPPLVPGSRPTTFQVTGDMGVGRLERTLATKDQAGKDSGAFNTRRAEQNQARVDALQGLERGGDPKAVSGFFRQHIADLDDQVSAARADLDALGPANDARLAGLQADNAAELAGLRTTADRQIDTIGGRGTPDEYGAAARRSLQEAGDRAKAAAGRLLNAVDPDGTMLVDASTLRQGATRIRNEMSDMAAPMAGEERDIFNAAQMVRNDLPFRDLMALRSRLSEAMRAESRANGQSQSFRRMTSLRSAIEDTLAATIERRATQDADAVARGVMSPEDTMTAELQRQVRGWYGDRVAQEGVGQSAGTSDGRGGYASGGPSGVRAAPGAQGQGRGQPGNASGDPGVQAPPGGATPTYLDEAARERLNAGTEAYRQYAETYKRGPVGDVLRRGETAHSYRLPDATVSARIFSPGPDGFRRAEVFMSAAGRETAEPVLADIAAMQLRRYAARPDGSLDPAKVARFRQQHTDALRAIPDTDARFATVEGAERAIGEAAVRHRHAIEAAEADAAAQVLGARDRLRGAEAARRDHGAPSAMLRANTAEEVRDVIGGMFGSKTPHTEFARLAEQVKDNPEARQGVRRAIAQWIQTRFMTTTEAGTSGTDEIASAAFQKFMRDKSFALAPFFSAEEQTAMRAIADDLHRANRSIVATKLPGSPNTAADLTAVSGLDTNHSILRRVVTLGVGGGLGTGAIGAPWGPVLGTIAADIVHRWRDAGFGQVNQILTEAMLNPRFARDLLRKYPARPNSIEAGSLAGSLANASMVDIPDPITEHERAQR